MDTSQQTFLEELFLKLGPYTITEAEPELRHPTPQLGGRWKGSARSSGSFHRTPISSELELQ